MSDFEEQVKRLSPEEQKVTRMLVGVSQSLYREAEAQLLEGFRHTERRPQDGFDALVMVCSLARAIQSLAIGLIDLGPASRKEHASLEGSVLTIGGVMGHGLIPLSTDFPFSAEEMVSATSPHVNAGTDALSSAVAEAAKRIAPAMIEVALYFASTYPEENAALVRLIVGDLGPTH